MFACRSKPRHRRFNPHRNGLPPIAGIDISWLIRTTGPISVWTFFVLSGYLKAKGFYTSRYEATREDSLKFYLNRLIRIYPLYVISILGVVFFAQRKEAKKHDDHLRYFLKTLR